MEIKTIAPTEVLPNEVFEVPDLMGQYRMIREVHRDSETARYLVNTLPAGNAFHLVLPDWRKVRVMR